MPAVATSCNVIRFGAYEVDARAGELRKQGVKIKLQDQPFQVLLLLLEKPGEVVTREELQKRIWPADTFVDFDHGIANAVKRLRDALSDSRENPRFIETLPRKGYRFIASAQTTPSSTPSVGTNAGMSQSMPASPPAPRRRLRFVAVASGVLLAMLAGIGAGNLGVLRDRRHTRVLASRVRSIAVLPLTNLSENPDQEYLSEGITDALITELSQISNLRVISRTTTIRYKKTDKTLPQLAKDLGVDAVVEGTVQRSGDRVRVTAQLIYAPEDRNLWAKSYEQDLRDILQLEQNLASAIARQIQAQLSPQLAMRLGQPRQVDPKALEAYLQGRYHLNHIGRGAGREDYRSAIAYFQQAIAQDPGFAPAYAWLADAYDGSFAVPKEVMPLEKEAIRKALELDPHLAKTHQILGSVRLFYDWDWLGAETELKQARDLDPNSAWTRNRFSMYLTVMGRREEAINEAQRARELDPAGEYLSETLTHFGQYDQAIEVLRRYLEFNPSDGFAHYSLFWAYSLKGMPQEAIHELQETWRLFGFANAASAVRKAYSTSGYSGALRESAKQLEQLYNRRLLVLPVEIAGYYALLGDKKQALNWLNKGYEARDGAIVFLARDPVWDFLRPDPRFQDLVRRVGLSP
jgi:TolB-like protein/DNA-binding winged helix-turn-helix (wHTH) protein